MMIAAVVALLLLALMGAPLFAIILAAAALGYFALGIDLTVLHIDIYQVSSSVVLMALPLFTFAGFLLGESKTADRMLRLSQAAFGWMPGGMAFVALVACAFFTALTGGSGVTIVALGVSLLRAIVSVVHRALFHRCSHPPSDLLDLIFVPCVPPLFQHFCAANVSPIVPIPVG